VKALIVDDEVPARTRLKRLLEKYDDLVIIGEAADGLSALEEIERLKPDIVFLDIEMPELDGLEVAETLKEDGPRVVFVTAYNEHALKAFELSAADYLVKPIAEARLDATIRKLQKEHSKNPKHSYSELIEALTEKQTSRRLAVRCGAKFIVFDPDNISAIVARDHYAAIVADGRELLADDSLDILEKRLNAKQFIRIHRSAIINIHFLKELEREGDRKYIAVLNDSSKTRVPVSRERLPELKAQLGISS
jgi:DNA-binding LytR/AlgR family response regulator